MKRLAIITTHPIQYNAPMFRLLNEHGHIYIKVFYTWGQSASAVFDAKFGITRSWDVPLLEGYEYEFLENTSRKPDSNRFFGVVNPGLLKKIKDGKFDAVMVNRWSLYSHLLVMQCLPGNTKLFFRGDSHLLNESKGISTALKTILLKWVYRKVSCAFFVGKYNREYYLKYGLDDKRLKPALHAVDNSRFIQESILWEQKAQNERFRLGIPDNAVVFLYAGKFYDLKQTDLLVRTFMEVKGDKYRLLLIGNGDQEMKLKEVALQDKRIIFQPFHNQSDMPWVYRIGDVFVLPSKSETWGLGVNEAMACSRPAIVSDMCGCGPELIIDNVTGFIFQSGSMESLKSKLMNYNSRSEASIHGKNAFQHIQSFTLDRFAEAIEREMM